MTAAASIQRWLQNLSLPGMCLICNGPSFRSISLCSGCESHLPRLPVACERCAMPLPHTTGTQALCGRCMGKLPAVNHCWCPFIYTAPVSNLLTDFKYRGNFAAGKALAMLMAPAVLARVIEGSQQAQEIAMPEVLIPVPLHPLRLRARGFNQALELARVLSREVNIPLCSALVVRHRNTRPQSHLTGSERIKNLKQAFTLACPETRVRWRHAAIIDDVVTTMATCNALAEMMKEEGVKRVDVWAIARAVGN